MRLAMYGLVSGTLSAALVAHAFQARDYHFFAACVHLTRSPLSVLVLLNLALFGTIVFSKFSQKIFFGELRAIEVEHLYERSWLAIVDTCLAMTIFKDEFDLKFIFLFAFLLYLKIFHWITADRVDFMEQMPELDWNFQIRIGSAMALLTLLDQILLAFALRSIIKNGPDMILVFAFEFMMLLVSSTATIGKYVLHYIDFKRENPWDEKSQFIFYIELAADFLKLLVYVAFFAVIIMHYGLPINIIRDLYITLRSFILKCKELYQYRMATHNMRERYPNATLEELEATDKLCIICREEMTILTEAEASSSPLVPKKLHCGHIFHFRCLRSWLERQQACPTCRRSVLETPAPPPTETPQQQQNNVVAGQHPQNQPPAGQGLSRASSGSALPQQFATMEDFLRHIEGLSGPNNTKPHIVRISPLQRSQSASFTQLEKDGELSHVLPELSANDFEHLQKDPKALLRQKIKDIEHLQVQTSALVTQVKEILEHLPEMSVGPSSLVTDEDRKGKGRAELP